MVYLTTDESTATEAASFLQKIKKATAAQHLRLESQSLLSAIMSPSVTHLQYYYYLILMKKIEEGYDGNIVRQLVNTFPDFEQRRGTHLIALDLSCINSGIPIESVAVKDYSIPCEKITIPFAWGFMYVMEGSKLGGKVIYKHINRTLGYSEECGAKYIADFGNNTSTSWKKFLSGFSMYVVQNNCEEATIQGAQHAFNSIYEFFAIHRLV